MPPFSWKGDSGCCTEKMMSAMLDRHASIQFATNFRHAQVTNQFQWSHLLASFALFIIKIQHHNITKILKAHPCRPRAIRSKNKRWLVNLQNPQKKTGSSNGSRFLKRMLGGDLFSRILATCCFSSDILTRRWQVSQSWQGAPKTLKLIFDLALMQDRLHHI